MSEEKVARKLAKKLGREPTAAEVAKKVKKLEKKKAKAAAAGEAAAAAASPVDGGKEKKKKRKSEGEAAAPTKKAKGAGAGGASGDGGVGAGGDAWRSAHRVTVTPSAASEAFAPCVEWSSARSLVSGELVALCEAKGWAGPTPIQAQCWPILCADRDVVAVAETGSGKTLGFGMPALSKFKEAAAKRGKRQPAMLVLAPTRELANQSFEVLDEFCKKVGATAAVAYGGMPKHEQKKALATAAALVATPGRLNDFIMEGSIDLSMVSFFCLDEADRMLDMGFVQDVKKIAAACSNRTKLTAMFSATWPTEVQNIAKEFLKADFVRVNVGAVRESADEGPEANKRIDQSVVVCDERARDGKLIEILKAHYGSGTSPTYAKARLIVFGLYKKECARLEQFLNRQKWKAVAIHGDMSQAARNAAFDDFKSGAVPLLVATDVAARGLDIPNVELVVNFSFPLTIEDYVHRIGRTGRAGKSGKSIALFHGEGHEKALAGALQNVLRGADMPIPKELLKFGSTVKKKEHKVYGAFGPKGGAPMKAATKITFD